MVKVCCYLSDRNMLCSISLCTFTLSLMQINFRYDSGENYCYNDYSFKSFIGILTHYHIVMIILHLTLHVTFFSMQMKMK